MSVEERRRSAEECSEIKKRRGNSGSIRTADVRARLERLPIIRSGCGQIIEPSSSANFGWTLP